MINIFLSGARGRMGKAIAEAAEANPALRIIAGVDTNESGAAAESYPVFASPSDYTGEADVIVDFSHHTAADGLLDYAVARRLPIVICTTGHTEAELEHMKSASSAVAVFHSGNMSLGVNLLIELCRKAAAALEGFDVEIIEKHHNQKLDAPSGTALMIANAVADAEKERYTAEYVYDRHSVRRKREPNEIGIHSVRGGTIVGEHEVIFSGRQETVTISHTAESRSVFAEGALRAAAFIVGKPAGMYDMNSIIGQIGV